MKRLKYWLLMGLLLFSFQNNAYAFFGMDAAAMIPWLIKILEEGIQQYNQLKEINDATNSYRSLLEKYHEGLTDALNLLQSLPIRDEKILSTLQSFRESLSKIEDVYGSVPDSPESQMLRLHDDTVAESLKVINQLNEYAAQQERNADSAMLYAKDASPKGAARVTVETNAAILHTLNQLLRINGQMLKIQSENLAYSNKQGKDAVLHYNRVNEDMGKSLRNFGGDFKTPDFE